MNQIGRYKTDKIEPETRVFRT